MAQRRIGLNDLPDEVLLKILDKMSFTSALRCSLLSRRWRPLWRSVTNFHLIRSMFSGLNRNQIERIIDRILNSHTVGINLFHFEGLNVSSDKIIEWANMKHVNELYLRNIWIENMSAGVEYLTKLRLHSIRMNDTILSQMLGLCPILQTLALHDCRGLRAVDIKSPTLRFLDLDFAASENGNRINSLKVEECPLLESMVIKVLYHVEIMQFINLQKCVRLVTAVPRSLEPFENLTTLTEITLLCRIYQSDADFLCRFPNLKRICIDNASPCYRRGVMQQISGRSPLLQNVERVDVNIGSLEEALPLLAYFVQHAPAMKALVVYRRKRFQQAEKFVNKLFNLPRASRDAKIFLSEINFQCD